MHITHRLKPKHGQVSGSSRRAYLSKIVREHGSILSAVTQGDAKAARSAVRGHLEESMARDRRLLA